MKAAEIQAFIEEMKSIGDHWTESEVKDVYGDKSLSDALADRKGSIEKLGNIIGTVLNK